MSDPGQITYQGATAIRRRTLTASTVLLHVMALAVGVFAWPTVGMTVDTEHWRITLVLGDLAAIVSLASIGFILGRSSLGTQITLAVFTPIATWFAILLLLDREFNFGGTLFVATVASILNMVYLAEGVAMVLLGAWLRRRRQRTVRRHGTAAHEDVAKASRQFGLRHVMLWTMLTAIAFAALRTITGDAFPDLLRSEWNDLLIPLAFYSAYGLLQAATGLVTFACLSRRLRLLAGLMGGLFTALSFGASSLWLGENNDDVWPVSLITTIHFLMLSTSIVLLQLAGYHFARSENRATSLTTNAQQRTGGYE